MKGGITMPKGYTKHLNGCGAVVPGAILKTNKSGDFKVLRQCAEHEKTWTNGRPGYEIEFLNVNVLGGHTRMIVDKDRASRGYIKDPYQATVYGVACPGRAVTKINGKHTREYSVWSGMISRCYNTGDPKFSSCGYRGVTVCRRWLCFEFFCQDLPNIPGYEEWYNADVLTYDFDKDMLQQHLPPHQRVYSPETCMFLTQHENRSIKKYSGDDKIKPHTNDEIRPYDADRYLYPYPDGSFYEGYYYKCSVTYLGETVPLGTFTSLEAAHIVHNNYVRIKGLPNVPYTINSNMTLAEAVACRTPESRAKDLKQMCHIVNKNN